MPKYIRVKAVEGRVARDGPKGRYIPTDAFMEVQETRYIRRLIDVQGDLIEEGAASQPPNQQQQPVQPQPAPQPIPPVAKPTT